MNDAELQKRLERIETALCVIADMIEGGYWMDAGERIRGVLFDYDLHKNLKNLQRTHLSDKEETK